MYQRVYERNRRKGCWGRRWEEKRALTFMPIYNHLLSHIAHCMGYNRRKWKPLIGWNMLAKCHRVLTGVIHLLSSTRQQPQVVTHPSTNRDQCFLTCRIWLRTVCAMPSHHWSCKTSWEHVMSHKMYYMSYTIDKWNVYCSYIIKCIFAGIRISRFDHAKKK